MYNNSRACCFGSSLQRKVCAIRARGGIPPTIIYNIIKERLYMKAFMDKDFLLETPTAQHLYHDYSAKLPIVESQNRPQNCAKYVRCLRNES